MLICTDKNSVSESQLPFERLFLTLFGQEIHLEKYVNSADPDQMSQNVASDQSQYC